MSSEVLLTINLQGEIGGCVRSTTIQSVTVEITPADAKHPVFITREIIHTDRRPTECFRSLKISETIVEYWESSECPQWVNVSLWKKMTKRQRVNAHIKRFDEGFGTSFSMIE